jgi:hypothetical protein
VSAHTGCAGEIAFDSEAAAGIVLGHVEEIEIVQVEAGVDNGGRIEA